MLFVFFNAVSTNIVEFKALMRALVVSADQANDLRANQIRNLRQVVTK